VVASFQQGPEISPLQSIQIISGSVASCLAGTRGSFRRVQQVMREADCSLYILTSLCFHGTCMECPMFLPLNAVPVIGYYIGLCSFGVTDRKVSYNFTIFFTV